MLTDQQAQSIAQAIHEIYRRGNPGSRYDMAWDDLPDDIKKSNLDQAKELVGHIAYLGMTLNTESPSGQRVAQLTPAQVEAVARRVHDIWMKSKLDSGYTLGADFDGVKKLTPLLVPYDALPEKEKDKDRAIVLNIIPLFQKAGISVYGNE